MAPGDLRRRAERRGRRPGAGTGPAVPGAHIQPAGQDAGEDEAALVARIGTGDEQAFRLVVERHLDPVAGFARRLLNDAAEADDVAQETFLRLWREAARWQPRARLAAWLYRVAYNLSIDRMRRRRATVDIAQLPDPPSPALDPEQRLAEAEIAGLVNDAIDVLPERQRAAIVLVHQRRLGNIEAASVLGVSVDALESLLARGRRQLRQALGHLQSAGAGDR